tara:strand:- start:399 stop:623 length:225 start_codon:yes stop_codon:yes gene_type:complete
MIEKALKQIESAKKLITEMTGFLAEVENKIPEEQKADYLKMKKDLLDEVQKGENKINTKKIFELWEQKVSNSGE